MRSLCRQGEFRLTAETADRVLLLLLSKTPACPFLCVINESSLARQAITCNFSSHVGPPPVSCLLTPESKWAACNTPVCPLLWLTPPPAGTLQISIYNLTCCRLPGTTLNKGEIQPRQTVRISYCHCPEPPHMDNQYNLIVSYVELDCSGKI